MGVSRRGFHILQPAHSGNELLALRAGRSLPLGRFLVLISVRGWVDSRTIVQLEGGVLLIVNYPVRMIIGSAASDNSCHKRIMWSAFFIGSVCQTGWNVFHLRLFVKWMRSLIRSLPAKETQTWLPGLILVSTSRRSVHREILCRLAALNQNAAQVRGFLHSTKLKGSLLRRLLILFFIYQI
jgi:hypothetical protein